MIKQIISLLIFISIPSFAAKTETGFLISTELSFKSKNIIVRTKNQQILEKDMNAWMPLNSGEKGIVFLGRKASLENDILNMEFMVIDTNQKPIEISQPSIITELGKSGEISINEMDDKGKPTNSINIKFSAKNLGNKTERMKN